MLCHKGSLIGVQNPRDAAIRLLRITPDGDAQAELCEEIPLAYFSCRRPGPSCAGMDPSAGRREDLATPTRMEFSA
jgi:hypothetical protein